MENKLNWFYYQGRSLNSKYARYFIHLININRKYLPDIILDKINIICKCKPNSDVFKTTLVIPLLCPYSSRKIDFNLFFLEKYCLYKKRQIKAIYSLFVIQLSLDNNQRHFLQFYSILGIVSDFIHSFLFYYIYSRIDSRTKSYLCNELYNNIFHSKKFFRSFSQK